MKELVFTPITLTEAMAFVDQHHRHHKAPQGGLFAIAVSNGEEVLGVAIVGRPVARMVDDGWTAEVTRLCTVEGAPMGIASKLYARAAQVAQLMGYRRVISYILASETGVSLKAAGWRDVGLAGGGSWSRPLRPRVDKHPIEQKRLWESQERWLAQQVKP